MRKHTEKNPGLVRRILNWIEDMLNRVRGINDPEVERLKQARELYRECLETAEQNNEKQDGIKYSLKQTDGMTWEQQMNALFSTNKKDLPNNATLNLGDSGVLYTKYGMNNLPFAMERGVVNKAMRETKGSKSAHGMSENNIRGLKSDVENPVAVIDEPNLNSILVIAPSTRDSDGQAIGIAITKNSVVDTRDAHSIRSVMNIPDVERILSDAPGKGYTVDVLNENRLTQLRSVQPVKTGDIQSASADGQIVAQDNERVNPDSQKVSHRFVDDATAARFEEANKANDAAAIDDMYMEAVKNGDYDTMDAMVNSRAEYLRAEVFAQTDVPTYKIRRGAEPKKTIKVYKTFTMSKEGNPTALFVSSQYDLPVGVWLDAQDTFHFTDQSNGHMYVPSTKNPNTKGGATGRQTLLKNISEEDLAELERRGYIKRGQNGEYTAKNLTSLAYRPGWHAGDLPFFPQGGMKIDGSNYENVHRYLFVPYGASPDGLFAFLRGTPPLLYKRRFIGYNDRRKWQTTLL